MLPRALSIYSSRFPTIHVPTGPFDPKGELTSNFIIWMAQNTDKYASVGSLRFHKSNASSGNIQLQVDQSIRLNPPRNWGITTASLTCRDDALSTPVNWKVASKVTHDAGKIVDLTEVSITGKAAGGIITLHREKDRQIKMPGPFTSNWSLIDAVQRLPFDSKVLKFDLLEDLELHRPEQRLAPGQTAEVELGGRTIKLHSFEQVGRGIPPTTYWLDDQHRLVFVIAGLRALLYDSNPARGGVE